MIKKAREQENLHDRATLRGWVVKILSLPLYYGPVSALRLLGYSTLLDNLAAYE